jgi:hypothetical protein
MTDTLSRGREYPEDARHGRIGTLRAPTVPGNTQAPPGDRLGQGFCDLNAALPEAESQVVGGIDR